jgi:succinate dehydrogenase / fumarate reductase flavoprotein subunit
VSYDRDMLESMRRVEATRPARLHQTFPRLTPEDKQALLQKFHPDYRPESMRPLAVGPNAGDRVPHEVANLLEGVSRIDPEAFDLTRPDEDGYLIVAAAGLGRRPRSWRTSAARSPARREARIGDANTMMAQGASGGRQGQRLPAMHYRVMGGGGFTNIPGLVRALTRDAPAVIKWLEELGAMLDKQRDGTMVSIHGGGTCRRRMHSARDYSGAEIMRTLRDEFKNRRIPIREFTAAVELVLTSPGSAGAICTTWRPGSTAWSAPRA